MIGLAILQADLKNDKENAILVYGRGWINAVSGIDGEILWRTDFSIGRLA